MTNSDGMQTALDNFSKLCAVLDDNKIKYEKNQDELSVHFLVKGKELPVEILIKFNPQLELLTLYSPLPFTVKEDNRKSAAVGVARVNFGMPDGNFDFNYSTGKIVFRMTAGIANSILGKDAFEYVLFTAIQTAEEYGGKLLTVCEKNMSVDQICNFID